MLLKKSTTLAVVSGLLLASMAASAETVKIGALMPLTGGLQSYGEACLNGVKMAVEEINAGGGLLGEAVVLQVGDTQTKAQPALDAAKKLVSIEGVAGIVGALSSGNTIPVAQTIAAAYGVPLVSPASTAPTITDLADKDFLFRTVPSDAFQGVALAKVVSEQGFKKVAVLYVNNDYGQGLAESFSATFKNDYAGTVTGQAAFEPNNASYRGELSQLASGGPEALLLISYPDDGGILIVRQSLEEGLFDSFIFTDGMKAEKVIETIGAQYLDGTFGTSPKALATDTAQMFKTLYEKTFGELPPRPYIDSSYDATAVLLLAIAKANSTEGSAVRDALREVTNAPGLEIKPGELAKGLAAIKNGDDINYVGAAGDHEFDTNGDVSGTFEHWHIKDGKLETVTVFAP